MAKIEVVGLYPDDPSVGKATVKAPQAGDTYRFVRDVFLTTGVIKSEVADGASAVGVVLDTENAFSTAGAKIASFRTGGTEKFYVDKDGNLAFPGLGKLEFPSGDGRFKFINNSGTLVGGISATGVVAGSSAAAAIGVGSNYLNPDTRLSRISAGIWAVGSSGNGQTLQFEEQTAPSAPSANQVRIYAQDNGAGKTQLMALFSTGAAQQIAIEP